MKKLISSVLIALFLGVGSGYSFAIEQMVDTGTSSSAKIKLLSQISTENQCGNSEVYDMTLIGNTLYTGGHGWCGSGGSPVYDVSNPANPSKLYEIDTYPNHLGVAVRDGIYYAATEQGMAIYDVSGGSPALKSFLSLPGEGYDIDLVGDIAYYISNFTFGQMAGRSGILTAVDIANLQYPSAIGYITFNDYPIGAHPPYPTNVIVNGNYAYVGKEGFLAVDIRDPAQMTIVGRNDIKKRGGLSLNRQDDMQISGDRRVFKAHQHFGIFVFFVDNYTPTKPFLETIIDFRTITLGGNIAFSISGNTMFVATAADRKFKVLDITNVNSPIVRGEVQLNGSTDSTVEVEVDYTRKLAFVSTKGFISVFDVQPFLP